MFNINSHIPVQIQTQYGVIPINQLTIGDNIYEYKTGKELKVKQVIQSEIDDIYKITYTDGRTSSHLYSDIIFIGDCIVDLKTLLNRTTHPLKRNPINNTDAYVGNIRQYPQEYRYPIVVPPNADPYIAGALITYGDNNDPYINLPLDRRSANQLFAYKYNVEYGDKIGNNKVYFRYTRDPERKLITWNDFFPNYNFYSTTSSIYPPIIPIEYTRGSLNNRKQFLQGVFDIGYDIKMFPDTVAIAHTKEFKLQEIQKMLWSMGVLSKISYDPNIPASNKRNFRLDVVGDYEGYPGFFYDINKIENSIINTTKIKKYDKKFKLQLACIEWITRGYMYNIVLEEPHMLYMADNFLPRVSL